jgi:hypothetical protein
MLRPNFLLPEFVFNSEPSDGIEHTKAIIRFIRSRGGHKETTMNIKFLTVSALAAAVTVGTAAPALADGAASVRNILIGGAAAAVLITNYNHKKHIKQNEQREQSRRQSSYRSYFYHRYGYYPSQQQFRDWYHRTYGVYPS